MPNQKMIYLLGAVTILTVLSVVGLQIKDIIAEETEDKGYKFAEDTDIITIFKFREGVELSTFEVFTQKSGWDADDAVIFELQHVAGKTPMLYEATDQARKYSRNGIAHEFNYKFFDVDVTLAHAGEVLRQFEYKDCQLTDYNVETLTDKEEGWMGKGFAVIDTFEFTCDGYYPKNILYEQMHTTKKADTTSTLDLKESFYTWSDHFKATTGRN
jgi:hypothetical protein